MSNAVDPTVVHDVVVVVPGIMGSELTDRRGRRVWSVGLGALGNAIRTFGNSVRQLELPDGIGDGHPGDGVEATGLVNSLHVIPGLWSPVKGYDGLMEFLRSERFHLVEGDPNDADVIPNLIPFPYDWRLSNVYNGRRLAAEATAALERWRSQPGMSEAKLILVCHSMGGLVARWFAEQEGGAEDIRAIITIGTPHRGAVNAVETLVNGIDPGLGRLRLRLTDFARSLPSMHQLLPQYDCLVTAEGRTDLLTAGAPGMDTEMVADAFAFHHAITGHADPGYTLHKVVGIRQPTRTTVRIADGEARASYEIDGLNQGGDGTVPRLAAEPVAGRGREVHEVADQHAALPGSRSLLDLVDGIITREQIIWQAAPPRPFGLAMADLWSTKTSIHLQVTDLEDRRMWVWLGDEAGRQHGDPVLVDPDGYADLGELPEGGYTAAVGMQTPGAPPPVTKAFLVLDPDVPIDPDDPMEAGDA